MASGISQCSVVGQDSNPCGEPTTTGSEMPQSKGDKGAGAGVVGWAPDISPTDASSIVPGRKEERAGEVAGGARVRWQEAEGGPGLVASVSSGATGGQLIFRDTWAGGVGEVTMADKVPK